MANPLKIASPPPRRVDPDKKAATPFNNSAARFDQIKENERVQFNKRVDRRVADGYEMLAIRTRRKVPELLSEALALLEERYGKI